MGLVDNIRASRGIAPPSGEKFLTRVRKARGIQEPTPPPAPTAWDQVAAGQPITPTETTPVAPLALEDNPYAPRVYDPMTDTTALAPTPVLPTTPPPGRTITSSDKVEMALNSGMRGIASTIGSIPKAAGLATTLFEADEVTKERNSLEQIEREFGMDLSAQTLRRPEAGRLYQAGQAIEDIIPQPRPELAPLKGSFLYDTLPGAAGSMAASIGTGVVGGGIGAPALLTMAATGAAGEAASQYDQATAAGVPFDKASAAAKLGGIIGTSEAIPLERIINRATGGMANKVIKETIKGAIEEGLQEAGQTAAGNLIARNYYDPNRPISEGVAEGAAAGAITGGGASGIAGMIARARARRLGQQPPSQPRLTGQPQNRITQAPTEPKRLPPDFIDAEFTVPEQPINDQRQPLFLPGPSDGSVTLTPEQIDAGIKGGAIKDVPAVSTGGPDALGSTSTPAPALPGQKIGDRIRGKKPQPTPADGPAAASPTAAPPASPLTSNQEGNNAPTQIVQPISQETARGDAPAVGGIGGGTETVSAPSGTERPTGSGEDRGPELSNPEIPSPVQVGGLDGAHDAATSPLNDRPEPTQAQKDAGNYKVGRVKFGGLDISIENPIGSERKGVDKGGKPWSVPMTAHYGYIRRTEGADGDHVDVYLPDNPREDAPVHVFNQHDPATGKFDEHKVVLGAESIDAAKRIYDAHFSDGSGPQRRASFSQMSLQDFKEGLESGRFKKALDVPATAVQQPKEIADGKQEQGAQGQARDEVEGQGQGNQEGLLTQPAQTTPAAPTATAARPDSSIEDRINSEWADKVSKKIDEWVANATKNGTRPMDRNWERGAVKRFIESELPLHGKQDGKHAALKIAAAKADSFEALKNAIDKFRPAAAAQPDSSSFTIVNRDGTREPAIQAQPATFKGLEEFQFFTHDMSDEGGPDWRVSEASTGRVIAQSGQSREDAIDKAEFIFRTHNVTPEKMADIIAAAAPVSDEGHAKGWSTLPYQSRKKFDEAFAAKDGAKMRNYLHVANKVIRREFTHRTGRKLPMDMAGWQAAVDQWAAEGPKTAEPAKTPAPAKTGGTLKTEGDTDAGDQKQPGRVGTDGGTPLAGESPEPGPRAGVERPTVSDPEGAGDGGRSDVRPAEEAEAGSSAGDGDRAERPDTRESDRDERPTNYRITEADRVGEGGIKEKFKSNVAAVRALKQIESENRLATRAEQSALVKFVGWGGMPQAFEDATGKWTREIAELKELFSPDELAAARASTINAHYTSPEVISAMWEGLKALGFKGGAVVEPGMGVGHFFGLMPPGLSNHSKLTGVELDSVTGRIATKLYPQADIYVRGFEKLGMADNSVDLFIGNVPFANVKVADSIDRDLGRLNASLHDYFFAKALKKVRPGGLVAFITSRYTLDKKTSQFRDHMAGLANLVGAVRLPYTAFKGNANTEVVTDILIFQKRPPGTPYSGQSFETVRPFKPEGQTASYDINQYFAEHPENIVGTLARTGTMYGANEINVEPKSGISLGKTIAKLIGKMKVDAAALDPIRAETEKLTDPSTLDPAPDHVREGEFHADGEKITQRRNGKLHPIAVGPTKLARMRGMLDVRDAARKLQKYQITDGTPDSVIADARKALNKTYDAFTKKHGFLSTIANRSTLRDDPGSLSFLLSLEEYDAEEGTAKKAAIFEKRTQHPHREIVSADNAIDALSASLGEHGRVDLDYMGHLLGKPQSEIVKELRHQIYEDPETGEHMLAGLYLAGNVREKLAKAKEAAVANPKFKDNVEALEKVIPEDLTPGKITARLGASWVEEKDYQQFARDVFGDYTQVTKIASEGSWALSNTNSGHGNFEYGTQDYSPLQIMDRVMNHRDLTVRRKIDKDTTIIDRDATAAAQAKAEKIRERFERWLWENQDRANRLVRKYNDDFNNLVAPTYDGSHLTLPGAAAHINLRPHQKNVVWRYLSTGNVLLDHVVGAGKTWAMATMLMEGRRIGVHRKPVLVVPNHLVAQWPAELLSLYPGANVLAATAEDFSKERRQTLMNRIATGDWHAIIVPMSSFERMPISPARMSAFFNKQLDELEDAIRAAKAQRGDNRNLVKELEKAKKRLEGTLADLAADWKKDSGPYFDELGIDALFVDEAHEFKNLWFRTSMSRVPGIAPQFVQKTFDMLVKTEYINEKTNERGVVFATGTPVSNSVTEMFTLQRYMKPSALRARGIEAFDFWANSFGDSVTAPEVSPEGGRFRMHTRFAKFVNLPELSQMYRMFSDVQTAEMLKLPVPKVQGGGPKGVTVESTDIIKGMVDELMARADAVRQGKVDPTEDNMLAITTDGRKLALDPRLIDPNLPDYPGSKLNVAADKIAEIYHATSKERSAQLVWSDLGAPGDADRFNVHAEVKKKLIERGVKAEEIAFIHDAKNDGQRATLFKKVRAGKIRVLIATRPKLATGANIQTKLIAAHHLDAPWKPAQVEQADGRIIRQGNENDEIQIYRYVTKGTFDAYMWQTLETKAKFIQQIKQGGTDLRESGDIDDAALTYAEMKALAAGNPKIMEWVRLGAEVQTLAAQARGHRDQQYTVARNVEALPDRIKALQKRHSQYTALRRAAETIPADADFAITLGETKFTEMGKAGEHLLDQVEKTRLTKARGPGGDRGSKVGTHGPFDVWVRWEWRTEYEDKKPIDVPHIGFDLRLTIDPTIASEWMELGSNNVGMMTRIRNTPGSFAGHERHYADIIKTEEKRLDDARKVLGAPFEKQAELDEKAARYQALSKELEETGKDKGGAGANPDLGDQEQQHRTHDDILRRAGLGPQPFGGFGMASRPVVYPFIVNMAGKVKRAAKESAKRNKALQRILARQRGEIGTAHLDINAKAKQLRGLRDWLKLDPENSYNLNRAMVGQFPMNMLPKAAQKWVKEARAMHDAASRDLIDELVMAHGGENHLTESIRNNIGTYLAETLIPKSVSRKLRDFATRKHKLRGEQFKFKRDKWAVRVGNRHFKFDTQAEAHAFAKDLVNQAKSETIKKVAAARGVTADDLNRLAAKHRKIQVIKPIPEDQRREMFIRDPLTQWAISYAKTRQNAANLMAFRMIDHKFAEPAPIGMTEAETEAWAKENGFEAFKGTANTIGVLAGKYGPKRVAREINETTRAVSRLERIWSGYLNLWKTSKTVWNPATHFRNVAGNAPFADFAGVDPTNPLNLRWYAAAAQELRAQGEDYRWLVKQGVLGSEYFGNEVEQTTKYLEAAVDTAFDALVKAAQKAGSAAGAAYNVEDQIFKMAAYLKLRGRGVPRLKAAREVNRWFPNYAELHPVVRTLSRRVIGAPFLAFNEQSARIAGRAAVSHPLKLAKWAALPGILSAIGVYLLGLDDDEQALVDSRRGYAEPILPSRDSKGAVRTLDLRYVLPWANELQGFLGSDKELVLPGLLQQPIVGGAVDASRNRDIFTGREIYKEKDTTAAKIGKSLVHMLKGAAPVPSVLQFGPKRIKEAITGESREGVLGAVAGAVTGVNARGQYVRREDAYNQVRELAKGDPGVAAFLERAVGPKMPQMSYIQLEKSLGMNRRFQHLLDLFNEAYRRPFQDEIKPRGILSSIRARKAAELAKKKAG